MPKNGESVKEANRRIRNEAIREELSQKATIRYIIDNIEKIEKLDSHSENANTELTKLTKATELRLKLLNKTLPDLKAVDIEGSLDTSLTIVRKSYQSDNET